MGPHSRRLEGAYVCTVSHRGNNMTSYQQGSSRCFSEGLRFPKGVKREEQVTVLPQSTHTHHTMYMVHSMY
jgi:hypothetical protein